MKIKTRRYYIYYLAGVAGFFIAILPVKLGLYLADLAGKVIFAILGGARNTVINNLKSSFPEKEDREIRKIAKEVFSNICKNAVELVNFYKINKGNIARWIKVEGMEKVERSHSQGKGFIILASHFGNWELISVFFAFRGYRPLVIARKIYFEKYDNFITTLRKSKGVEVAYRDESPKKILKALKENRGVGILADQDVDSVNGVFVDFFGKAAYTPKAPVSLAMASGASLTPAFLIREKGYHKLIFEEPIKIEKKPENKEETIRFYTQRWTSVLERYVRRYPSQWVWVHKRWKTQPGKAG